MASNSIASYRLVYFQPDPEDGERVCVALLFTAQDDVDVLFYQDFPKLTCLAPHIDSDLVRIFLEDLRSHLRVNPSNVDLVLKKQSPQLVTSEARKCVWPLNNQSRLYLMKRFLSVEMHVPERTELPKTTGRSDVVQDRLRRLIQNTNVAAEKIGENVGPQWILGVRVPQIRRVAFAVRKSEGVILIDGVDLSVLNPKPAVTRVARVAHTFWQYKRYQQEAIDRREIRKIGIVLNGKKDPGPAYKDAHDFAVHTFSEEADLVVDATRNEDVQALQAELAAE